MRGKALGFGIFLVMTIFCLIEVIGGNTSASYVSGAVIGGIVCCVYGFVIYSRLARNRIASDYPTRKRGRR